MDIRTTPLPTAAMTLRLELLWWLVTLVVLIAILFPIYQHTQHYPFWWINTLYVVLFITFTRLVFLLKHTFLARRQVLKVILGIVCLPLLFYLISELNYFQSYLDEVGLEGSFDSEKLHPDTIRNMILYVRSEVLFFGVGSIVVTLILFFRLIISVWRTHNKGTV